MKVSKYLIIESDGLENPIVFSPMFSHAQIGVGKKVVGAGFCYRQDDGSFCAYGESISLGIGSRSQDTKILNNCLERG